MGDQTALCIENAKWLYKMKWLPGILVFTTEVEGKRVVVDKTGKRSFLKCLKCLKLSNYLKCGGGGEGVGEGGGGGGGRTWIWNIYDLLLALADSFRLLQTPCLLFGKKNTLLLNIYGYFFLAIFQTASKH